MKVLLSWNSQVIECLEKQESLPKKTEKSDEQAAGSAIIKLSRALFLYTVQGEKRQEEAKAKKTQKLVNSNKQVSVITKLSKYLDK
eukprot:9531860-Ditylum_brightwellii.AAC.2